MNAVACLNTANLYRFASTHPYPYTRSVCLYIPNMSKVSSENNCIKVLSVIVVGLYRFSVDDSCGAHHYMLICYSILFVCRRGFFFVLFSRLSCISRQYLCSSISPVALYSNVLCLLIDSTLTFYYVLGIWREHALPHNMYLWHFI